MSEEPNETGGDEPQVTFRGMLAAAKSHGFTTLNLLHAFVYIHETEGPNGSDVARELGISSVHGNKVSNDLADRGLVQWVPQGTRRVFVLATTEQGGGVYDAIFAGRPAEEAAAEEQED